MHEKKTDNQLGFSLIELIIVVAIIGIMGTIAASTFQSYVNNSNLRTAARDLASDMANTKQRAVSEGLTYRMTINTGNNSYTIEQGNAAGTAFTVLTTKRPTAFGANLTINSTNYASNIIYLRPRGTTSAGNIVLQNSRGSTATITSNITGRTHVAFSIQ